MKKLEDIMDHYEWKDSGTMIPDNPLSAEEKTRILEKTLAKAGLADAASHGVQTARTHTGSPAADASSKTAGRSGREGGPGSAGSHRRKMWTLAAACVLVLAMATVSFAAIALDKNFFDFFGARNQEQQEMLGNLSAVIDRQTTDNGWTLDVREAVGDGNTVNVLFDLIAPEGTTLDQDYYSFSTAFVDLPDNPRGGAGYYFELLPDDDPADNKLTMMLCYDTERNLSGSTMRFRFSDLMVPKNQEEMALIDALPPRTEPGTPGDEYDVNKLVASGNWEIDFPLNYRDVSAAIKPDADISLYGGDCKITQVRYSPISVSMTIKGKSIAVYDSQPPEIYGTDNGGDGSAALQPADDAMISLEPAEGESQGAENGVYGTTDQELRVTLKDGTVVATGGTGTSITGNTLTVNSRFQEIIDPADIASISYGGVEIPVN